LFVCLFIPPSFWEPGKKKISTSVSFGGFSIKVRDYCGDEA